jgi:hypothetical protein
MKHFKAITTEDLRDMIIVTAENMHLSEGIIEKDYWVCFVLDYLFSDSPWKDSLAFKGGTSLSKCYKIISRFSEDIDLVLDWRLLGFKSMDPYTKRSQNQLNRLKNDIINKSNNFLKSVIKPKLESDFRELINESFKFYMDSEDTLCFSYPKLFDDSSILNEIRIEIGALSAWSPVEKINIQAYAIKYAPLMFEEPIFTVTSTQAKRTFWEKVIILHKTNYRLDSRFPSRYARHYYDIAMLYKSPYFQDSLNDVRLREDVLRFNEQFYFRNDYHLELAKPGHFKLVPTDIILSALQQDYISMTNMFFDAYPSFEELILIIQIVEKAVNSLEY